MTLFGALQFNAIAWIFASSTRCLMTLSSMAICTNPVCVLLPPPYDSPTLEFEERELRRLVQVRARARASLCQCVGRVSMFGDCLLCAASSAACEQGRPTFSVKYCLPVNLYSNKLFVNFSFIGFMLIPRSSSVKHGLRVLGSAPHYQPSVTYRESRLMCQACSCA